MTFTPEPLNTGLAQEAVEIGLVYFSCQPHRRQIAALDQGIVGADRAGKSVVKVLRLETAKGGGRILEYALRVYEP